MSQQNEERTDREDCRQHSPPSQQAADRLATDVSDDLDDVRTLVDELIYSLYILEVDDEDTADRVVDAQRERLHDVESDLNERIAGAVIEREAEEAIAGADGGRRGLVDTAPPKNQAHHGVGLPDETETRGAERGRWLSTRVAAMILGLLALVLMPGGDGAQVRFAGDRGPASETARQSAGGAVRAGGIGGGALGRGATRGPDRGLPEAAGTRHPGPTAAATETATNGGNAGDETPAGDRPGAGEPSEIGGLLRGLVDDTRLAGWLEGIARQLPEVSQALGSADDAPSVDQTVADAPATDEDVVGDVEPRPHDDPDSGRSDRTATPAEEGSEPDDRQSDGDVVDTDDQRSADEESNRNDEDASPSPSPSPQESPRESPSPSSPAVPGSGPSEIFEDD